MLSKADAEGLPGIRWFRSCLPRVFWNSRGRKSRAAECCRLENRIRIALMLETVFYSQTEHDRALVFALYMDLSPGCDSGPYRVCSESRGARSVPSPKQTSVCCSTWRRRFRYHVTPASLSSICSCGDVAATLLATADLVGPVVRATVVADGHRGVVDRMTSS